VRAIFGLGNPGPQYVRTRHNIGFQILDYFLQRWKIEFKAGRGDFYFARLRMGGSEVLLAKPVTFMNRSGRAVLQVMKQFSVTSQDMLIIYDDFHLPIGTFRFRSKGSDGGHNGISSIIYELETDVFDRFRFGIGETSDDVVSYVLSQFNAEEIEQINILLPRTKDAISCWIKFGMEKTMNIYNRSFLDEGKNE
jgi:PTH1 family peptidyl-tRNA hydrolase